MIENVPKISVLVITYNQEDVIKRAIDSLLSQKDYIYEICVSDDCSKDKTWEILQEYDRKNPGLFILNRNEPNVGIFENVEKTWSMATGDLMTQLAGDDECADGWYKKVIDYIISNRIDYINDAICIYGDYKAVYPNGDSFIFRNDAILKYSDAISLTTRGIIGNRSACWSKKVYKKFEKVSQGRSYIAESAQDKQLQLFSKQNYYIPDVGNIYFTGIGVSSEICLKRFREEEEVENYARSYIESHGYKYKKKDLAYLNYIDETHKLYRNNNFSFKLKLFFLYLRAFDFRYGIKGLRLKRYLFAIFRRLPHKRPIHWVI